MLSDSESRAFLRSHIDHRAAEIRSNILRRKIARGTGTLPPSAIADLRRQLAEQRAESARLHGLMTAEAVRLAGHVAVVDGFCPRTGALEVRRD